LAGKNLDDEIWTKTLGWTVENKKVLVLVFVKKGMYKRRMNNLDMG